ncbi:MAG: phosphate acyltransferase [Oscillibacter sp.]
MVLETIDQLVDIIRKSASPKRLAVAAAGDAHTLDAVVMAQKEGLVAPQLFGDAAKITKILVELGADVAKYEIIDAADDIAAAEAAVLSVHNGESDLLMKGMMQTGDIMRVVIDKEHGLLKEGATISLFTMSEMKHYHKLIVMTDSGIVRNPTLEQKKAIVENAVRVLKAYGYTTPKVAAVCAVEVQNPKMPETIDAAKLAEMSKSGELADCIVEGPLSMDMALSAEMTKYKGVESAVAGDPDVLLWPSVLVGNIAIKTAGCFGGIKKTVAFAVGAKAPIVLTSRGTDVEGKYLAILAAAAAS